MKGLYRKVLRKLGLHRQHKTEKIGDFLMTYEPSTDIGGKLYKGEHFEKAEIDLACKYIKSDSIVLDIGANIGLHAIHFSAKAKNGLVIAFEPQPKTFRTLGRNISQNGIKNIVPLNLAISDKANIANFYVMADDAYSSLVDTGRRELSEKINVLCTTVDGLIGEIKVDFVKIDVEGLELSVLQSMRGLLGRSKPVIFCEIYKGKLDAYNPNETISYLRNLGYSVNRIVDEKMVEMGAEINHDDCYYNYFFLPNKQA